MLEYGGWLVVLRGLFASRAWIEGHWQGSNIALVFESSELFCKVLEGGTHFVR